MRWHAHCAAGCHRRATRSVVAVGAWSRQAFMVTVAIFSADPVLRRNLEQLPRDDPALVIVGMVDQPSTLRELVNRNRVDVLLADVPPRELLPVYRSSRNEIIAAIKAAIAGLVVVPGNLLVTLLPEAPLADDLLKADGSGHARLTRRELEVLAAMADGASNKRSEE